MAHGSLPVPPRSDEELEKIALHYRDLIGLGPTEPVNVEKAIFKLAELEGRPTFDLTLLECSDDELPGDEAFADFNPPRIYIRRSLKRKWRFSLARYYSTLAHEVGHIVLHPGVAKARSLEVQERPKFVPPHKDSERQATVFGSAFLMPEAMVELCASPEELAELAVTSLEMARIRYDAVQRRKPRKLSPDILRDIEALKVQSTQWQNRAREKKSVLSKEQVRRFLWETAPEAPGENPNIWRLADGRWSIRWDCFERACLNGWRISQDQILAWEDEVSR